MPRTQLAVTLSDSQPGAAFKTGPFAMITGIKLDDRLGEWPSDRRQVAGSPDFEGTLSTARPGWIQTMTAR